MKYKKTLIHKMGLPILGISLFQLSSFAAAETMVYADICTDVTSPQNYLVIKKTSCSDNIKYTESVNASLAKIAGGRSTFEGFLQENGYSASTNAKTAQFFNGADLGFGRNMNCWSKNSNATSFNADITHLACFVGNYGVTDSVGRSVHGSLKEANLDNILSKSPVGKYQFTAGNPGHKPFATVAMEYNKGNVHEITFFAYNAAGQAVRQVELDSEKGKNIPGACISCHGGSFEKSTGKLTGSNFLPFDFNSFKFIVGSYKSPLPRSDATKLSDLEKNIEYGYTRIAAASDTDQDVKDQLKAIKGLNTMVYNQQKAAGKSAGEIAGKITSWYASGSLVNPEGGEITSGSAFDSNTPVTTANLAAKTAEIGCQGCHISSSSLSFAAISPLSVARGCKLTTEANLMPHGQLAASNTRDFLLAHTAEALANNCQPSLLSPIYKSYDAGYDVFRQLADVNKDGKADYCRFVGNPGSAYLSCNLAEANGFAANPNGYNSVGSINAGSPNTGKFADVDGDGYQDYCRFVGNVLNCTRGANAGFSIASVTSNAGIDPNNGTGLFTALANVNGKDSDGKVRADYCRFTEYEAGTNKAFLSCNLALVPYGFSSAVNYKSPQKIDVGFGFRQMIDVNKDGTADFCRFVNPSQPYLACDLAGVSGFAANPYLTAYKSSAGIDIGYEYFRQLADVNGDGYPEFCRFVGNPATAFLSCSKGYSNAMGNAGDTERVRSIVSLDKGDGRLAQLIDVNGDKKADYCRFVGDSRILSCNLAGNSDNSFQPLDPVTGKNYIFFLKDQFSFKPL